jgi:hypothetical protein
MKAIINWPDGTMIEVEGTAEEIRSIVWNEKLEKAEVPNTPVPPDYSEYLKNIRYPQPGWRPYPIL